MPLLSSDTYTTDYIYALPQGRRAELIDGRIYDMAPPNLLHQELVSELIYLIRDHIRKHGGSCRALAAPLAVFLNADDKNYVEPDISVICDKDRLDEKGCHGTPDWIIEIVSPSTQQMDYGIKLFKYRTAGVREYWIVNPATQTVNVFDFEHEKMTCQYGFDDEIRSCIFHDLIIRFADLTE